MMNNDTRTNGSDSWIAVIACTNCRKPCELEDGEPCKDLYGDPLCKNCFLVQCMAYTLLTQAAKANDPYATKAAAMLDYLRHNADHPQEKVQPMESRASNQELESVLEQRLIDRLNECGCLVAHLRGNAGKRKGLLKGIPDLWIMLPDGNTVLIEVKRPHSNSRLSLAQHKAHELIRSRGGTVKTIRSVVELNNLLEELN